MSKNVEFYNRAKELVSKMTMEEVCTQLSYESPEIKRLNVPSYNWWNEALHGVARAGSATSFPQAINLAAMFDDSWTFKLYYIPRDDYVIGKIYGKCINNIGKIERDTK